MWFLFQRGETMQQYVTRRFNSKRDLTLRGATHDKAAVGIPWLQTNCSSTLAPRITVGKFMQHGQDYARELGVTLRNNEQTIHYALAALAWESPKQPISREESLRLLQAALFDVDHFEELDADTRDLVTGEILEVINPHVESELPPEVFDKWFLGAKNSFVKQVAQRLKGFEGSAREVVKQVLLELFFESYEYIGQCIWAVMRDFESGLDPPLNDLEQARFRLLYYPQEMLGGLPLILLRDKLEFAEGILLRLLSDPSDERAVGALHQLLVIYADAVRWRRQVDRDRSRRRAVTLIDEVAATSPVRIPGGTWNVWWNYLNGKANSSARALYLTGTS
jgi:hypothetical protein